MESKVSDHGTTSAAMWLTHRGSNTESYRQSHSIPIQVEAQTWVGYSLQPCTRLWGSCSKQPSPLHLVCYRLESVIVPTTRYIVPSPLASGIVTYRYAVVPIVKAKLGNSFGQAEGFTSVGVRRKNALNEA